jgi:hypothetical protein
VIVPISAPLLMRQTTASLCRALAVGCQHTANGEKYDIVRECEGREKARFLSHRTADAAIHGAEKLVFLHEQILGARFYVPEHNVSFRVNAIQVHYKSYCTILS